MRHESLFFLYSGITRIKGVGGATAQALQRLLPVATTMSGNTVPLVRDLLFHLPVGIIDRRFSPPLNSAPEGVVATFVVTVDEHLPPKAFKRGAKKPYKVICSNETGSIMLVFFNAREDYIKQALPLGKKRVISGRVEHFDYQLQMPHPDIIAPVEQLAEVQKPEAVYPLTVGLTSRRIGKIVAMALEKLPELSEWIAAEWIKAQGWPKWKAALEQVHHPEKEEDLFPDTKARLRLAYDEILANQLYLGLVRRNMQQQSGEIIKGTGKLTEALLKSLPFSLTTGQKIVLGEISKDMESGRRMGRLLQGDVGSGKTVVAVLAMLRAIEQGLQVAFMAPTEIIAQQHYETLTKMLSALSQRERGGVSLGEGGDFIASPHPNPLPEGEGITVTLLTGSVKGKQRESVLSDIASGKAEIVIGTHALFQEHVAFKNLALVVIDEQHRFGVEQRMALSAKGNAPHLLHMTATPIPRSLTMTLYGDMDASLLTEKPPGRQAIATRVIPLSRYKEIMERMKVALDRGEKVYWICPLIEESEESGIWNLENSRFKIQDSDLAAAETRFTEFKARFGDIVGLVHGRMKGEVRDKEMRKFSEGRTRLLVATTVVEVGVDVRDATIMVIEKAERFGLSQLHQLRGRVGRGEKPSSCVLLYSEASGFGLQASDEKYASLKPEARSPKPALERLSILRETEDGFKIAEADLRLRGGGDLLGTRQSGLPRFIFTDIFRHQALLQQARDDVRQYLAADPQLSAERGQALRILLQLFGFEIAV